MSEPEIVIGIPHVGDLPGYFFDTVYGLIKPPAQCYIMRVENKPVDVARNTIVQAFLDRPTATHLFFMDADMTFPAKALARLAEHGKPVISGTYFSRTDIPVPHVYEFVRTDDLGQRWYHPMGEAYVEWLRGHPEAAQAPNAAVFDGGDGLVRCDAVGGGCLLAAREVFEAIPEPWFQLADGSAGGEDFGFCAKVQEAGIPIYADFGVQCDHHARESMIGRAEFVACFGIGEEDEHDFKDPLLVQVGPTGARARKGIDEVFRFPYGVEGYLEPEEGKMLYQLALRTPPDGLVVELGSYKGRSAICMAQAGRRVVCVDSFEGEQEIAGAHEDHAAGTYYGDLVKNLKAHRITNYSVLRSDTAAAADRFKPGSVSLLFIDAAHDYESVARDWQAWKSRMALDGVVAWHDVNREGVNRVLAGAIDDGWEVVTSLTNLIAIRRILQYTSSNPGHVAQLQRYASPADESDSQQPQEAGVA